MQGTNSPEFTNPDRWKLSMLEHFREMHRRNDLLQAALDKSIAEVAKRQAASMADPLRVELEAAQAEIVRLREQAARLRSTVVRAPRAVKERAPSMPLPEDLNLERIRIRCVREALARHEMLSEAAEALGVNRTTLYKCIEDYGLVRKTTSRMRPQQRRAS